MTKTVIPEPPDSVNGDPGQREIWKAIAQTRLDFMVALAGVKGEVRILIAVTLILVGAVIGNTWVG